jgi:hypothetical protein
MLNHPGFPLLVEGLALRCGLKDLATGFDDLSEDRGGFCGAGAAEESVRAEESADDDAGNVAPRAQAAADGDELRRSGTRGGLRIGFSGSTEQAFGSFENCQVCY